MKKSRVPEDFVVTARVRELARKNGWPDPDGERDGFVDYHLAHGSLMLDWEAAFRTWLRNAMKWNKGKPAQPLAAAPKLDRPKPQEDLTPAEVKAGRERFSRFMAELNQVTAKKAIT